MADIGATIDHIGIVGKDLGALERRFGELGFLVAPRCELVSIAENGSTAPMGQHNSHLVFANTYVELTAVTGGISGHHLEQALSRYFGLHIAVLLSRNAAADHMALRELGYQPTAVGVAGRTIDYPSGNGMGRFRWFRIPDANAPEAYFCFVEHLTPELVFDPKLNDHPNGAVELAGFTICVSNPEESAARLAPMCGADIRQSSLGTSLVMQRGTITLVELDRGRALYGRLDMPEPPFALGFTAEVVSLDKPASFLDRAGIRYEQEGNALHVAPQTAGQPFVAFVLRQA